MSVDYGSVWDKQYLDAEHKTKDFEWHCSFAQIQAVLVPYLESLLRTPREEGPTTLLDIGCGSSSAGLEMINLLAARPNEATFATFDEVVLTDISPVMLDILKERLRMEPQTMLAGAHTPALRLVLADCRDLSKVEEVMNMAAGELTRGGAAASRSSGGDHLANLGAYSQVASDSIAVVLDKGTMDALAGDSDKIAMLAECVRVLHPGGLFVSVSFSHVERFQLLQKLCHQERQIDFCDFHVIGGKDPAFGGDVRFLFVARKRPEPAGGGEDGGVGGEGGVDGGCGSDGGLECGERVKNSSIYRPSGMRGGAVLLLLL